MLHNSKSIKHHVKKNNILRFISINKYFVSFIKKKIDVTYKSNILTNSITINFNNHFSDLFSKFQRYVYQLVFRSRHKSNNHFSDLFSKF